jgi:hypothetical protein
MSASLSRVRFALRIGGDPVVPSGTWVDFDTNFGCIEDWSGLLSEGPIGGDIIEQDWTEGALWQQGVSKTYSFDVPFTALVGNAVNPNIWDSYHNGIFRLKQYRGPLLTMRRDIYDDTGVLMERVQAVGVLVTDLSMKVGIGRVLSSVAVFQNLSGGWPFSQSEGGPE